MKTRAGLPLLLIGLSLLGGSAWGFDAMRTVSGRVVHAPHVPWPVFVQADAIDNLSVTKVQTVTQAVIQTWNAVTDTKIQLAYGGLVRQAPHLGVYIWLDPNFQWANTDGTARADMEWNTDGELQAVEIALNGSSDGFQWVTGTSTSAADSRPGADLQSVLTHQIGHALGLAHSHEPTATMYFWGTGRAGRTLTDDDVRGLRFVYPAHEVTASTTCEPCRSDADCAGAGHCLAWPDGYAYCAAPCQSHEDCPIGTSCGVYSSGTACLPNDGHCNPDRAVDGPGEACAADRACTQSDLCMPIASGQGFCTSGCSADSDCGADAICTPGAFCASYGTGGDGSTCRVPGDCASAACMASTLRTGVCGRGCSGTCYKFEDCGDDSLCRPTCSHTCPDGLTCAADGVCRGPLAIGWPCSSGYDCGEGSCVALTGQRFDALCTKTCAVATDCPAGTGCATTTKGKLCLPGGALTVGSPCALSVSCGKGNGCDFADSFAGYGTCAPACDPFGTSSECSGGWCAWTGDATTASGICRAAAGGGAPGASCDGNTPCRGDLLCAQNGGAGICSTSCDPQAAVCGTGLNCIPLAGTTARGACMDGGALATEIPPLVVKPPVNVAARDVALPQVVPVAEFKPPTVATSPTTAKGCASARVASPGAGALVLLAGLVLGLRRRLRRR